MKIKVIVFDFDGTLVQSNDIKYNAYFTLFPNEDFYKNKIIKILDVYYEDTRFSNIERILKSIGNTDNIKQKVDKLSKKYGEIVLGAVKTCPEIKYAEKILKELYKKYALFLSSTTPHDALKDIIEFRKWNIYFKKIFGHPNLKYKTLEKIMMIQKISPEEIIVVGDGKSDEESAKKVGCYFYNVNKDGLEKLLNFLGNS